jgi:hypothetical protein
MTINNEKCLNNVGIVSSSIQRQHSIHFDDGQIMTLLELMKECANIAIEDNCAPFGGFVRDLEESTTVPKDLDIILRDHENNSIIGLKDTISRSLQVIELMAATLPMFEFERRDDHISNYDTIGNCIPIKFAVVFELRMLFIIEFIGFNVAPFGFNPKKPQWNGCAWTSDFSVNTLWMTQEGVSVMPFAQSGYYSPITGKGCNMAYLNVDIVRQHIKDHIIMINESDKNIDHEQFWHRVLKMLIRGWKLQFLGNSYTYAESESSRTILRDDGYAMTEVCDAYGPQRLGIYMPKMYQEEKSFEKSLLKDEIDFESRRHKALKKLRSERRDKVIAFNEELKAQQDEQPGDDASISVVEGQRSVCFSDDFVFV